MPFLPGHSFHDPEKTNYHKVQMFAVKGGGHMAECRFKTDENVASDVVNELARAGTPPEAYRKDNRPVATPPYKSIPAEPPVWVKHDRQVLRFMAYFKEHVHDNPTENFRVRKLVIMHHLDDQTTYVNEPKVENAGINQGPFMKRHVIPKEDGSPFMWDDFMIGTTVVMYGRGIRIYDCDEATRNFYLEQGRNQPPAEGIAGDNFDRARLMVHYKQAPEDAPLIREYNEVKLGGGHPNRNLESFIANDRKILSFHVVWNDSNYEGEPRYYTLNFFLSDKTIEVKEIRHTNAGRDNFPMLLRRQKLAKEPIITTVPALSLRNEEYYTPHDLLIGHKVMVYGREIEILDCDESTRAWYRENLAFDMVSKGGNRAKPYVPPNPVPEYNGYGTEEDSLGNVHSLNPKAPKLDMHKMFDNDMHIMRFEAKVISGLQEDEMRNFIVSFFPSDDTVKVFEVVERNAGIVGGKFLERRKYKNPYTRATYVERDFAIGRTIVLQDYRFYLTKADEYTHKFMESRPQEFPEANVPSVLRKIVAPESRFGNRQNFLIEMLRRIDSSMGDVIQFKVFVLALKDLGVHLTFQEEASLLRAWDVGNFNINVGDAYAKLQAV